MPLLGVLLLFQYSVLLGLPPLPWVWGGKVLGLDDHRSLVSVAALSTDTPSVQASREFTSGFVSNSPRPSPRAGAHAAIVITVNLIKYSSNFEPI